MAIKANDNIGLSTHDGHPLTAKEAKFIDVYVSGATQTQSYKEAYGETDSKKASAESRKIIRKPHIAGEIRHRMEEARDESIADLNEIMKYYTGVMRGEIKDAFGLDAPLSERTKCAVELARRMIDIENKSLASQQNEQPQLKITIDWSKNTNPEISSQNEILPPSENTNSEEQSDE